MPICAPWQVEGLSLSSPRPYFFPLKSNILEHDPLELGATIPKLGVHWTLMMPLFCGLGTSQGWAGTVNWSAPFPLLCLGNHYSLAILVWYQDSKVCASLFCFFILIGSKWASWWVIGGDASGTSSGLKSFRQGDNSRRWGLGNMMKLWCHDRHFHERKTQEVFLQSSSTWRHREKAGRGEPSSSLCFISILNTPVSKTGKTHFSCLYAVVVTLQQLRLTETGCFFLLYCEILNNRAQ